MVCYLPQYTETYIMFLIMIVFSLGAFFIGFTMGVFYDKFAEALAEIIQKVGRKEGKI